MGNSHQIFHVCVILGALIHLKNSIDMFHVRQLYPCPVKELVPFYSE